MPTDTDLSLVSCPRDGNRPAIMLHDVVQDPFEGTNMRLGLPIGAERHAVGGRKMLMDQQPLNGCCEGVGVARQRVKKSRVTPGIAQGNRLRIAIEVHECLPIDLLRTVISGISLSQIGPHRYRSM